MKIEILFYGKSYDINLEPTDTILQLREKLKEILNYGTDILIKYNNSYLDYDENKTISECKIQEGHTLLVLQGNIFTITFEDKEYKYLHPGCPCCGGPKDMLYEFMMNETGIPKDDFDLVHDSIILDKEKGLKQDFFHEFTMKVKKNYKKIKIIETYYKEIKELYIYYTDSINYEKIVDFIIIKHFFKEGLIYTEQANDFLEEMRKKFYSKMDLIFNGKILDQNTNLNEIDNLNEISVERKNKNI